MVLKNKAGISYANELTIFIIIYGVSEDSDATNMKYVNDQIAKLPHSDNGTLKLDGSRAITGNLNMGDHTIIGMRSSSVDNAALTVGGAKSIYFPLSGNRSMQGNLNMGKNFINNLKDPGPTNSNFAATVNFVNNTISNNNSTIVTNYQKCVDDRLKHSVQSANTSNAFQYVMDNPAINKETYEMQLLLDSKGYYSSRLGVNMYLLQNGL